MNENQIPNGLSCGYITGYSIPGLYRMSDSGSDLPLDEHGIIQHSTASKYQLMKAQACPLTDQRRALRRRTVIGPETKQANG